MRSKVLILVALLIAAGFVSFWLTRTVRFTEKAVVATFGRATERDVVSEPGLIFRWPPPIQTVTVYDTRARLLTAHSETQQTADNRQIVVQAFLTWRVSDPLKFFKNFGAGGSEERQHYTAAERTLQAQLRSAMSEVSRYTLGDLFNARPGASRLGELEQAVFKRLCESTGEKGVGVAEAGIEPLLVGIDRIVLPEDTTKAVFDRMKATQQRLASEAESRGEALASAIKASAEAAASRILSFAQARAQEIRVKGDQEAAAHYAKLNTESALAVFLEQIEWMRNFYGKRATLVLPTSMPGMVVFHPGLLGKLGPNGLPPFEDEPVAGESGQARAVPPEAENLRRADSINEQTTRDAAMRLIARIRADLDRQGSTFDPVAKKNVEDALRTLEAALPVQASERKPPMAEAPAGERR